MWTRHSGPDLLPAEVTFLQQYGATPYHSCCVVDLHSQGDSVSESVVARETGRTPLDDAIADAPEMNPHNKRYKSVL